MAYKSGFFSLIGCPNVGKSTLINALVGQKISIVTDRAQTTRNRITGVLTRDDYQMIFLDTPGMTTPKNKLGEYMQKTAGDCLSDVEAILFLVDARKGVGERDRQIMERLKQSKCPVIVLLNKCDIATKLQIDEAEEVLREGGFSNIHHISAFKGMGLVELEALLLSYLTEGPQYYPPDMVTDQPERLICATRCPTASASAWTRWSFGPTGRSWTATPPSFANGTATRASSSAGAGPCSKRSAPRPGRTWSGSWA